MKRVGLIVMLLALLAVGIGVIAAQEATEEFQPFGTVTSVRLNARAEPNAAATVLQTLNQNDTFPVIGRTAESTWWEIILDESANTTGWVFAGTFDVVGGEDVPVTFGAGVETATPSESAPLFTETEEAAVTEEAATEEATPEAVATEEAATEEATPEAEMEATEEAATEEATPEAEMEATEEAATEEATPEATPVSDSTATVLPALLNVRSGPGAENEVVGVVAQGETLPIVGKTEDNSWWQIEFEDEEGSTQTGWVFASFVQVTFTDAVPVVATPGQPAGTITAPVEPVETEAPVDTATPAPVEQQVQQPVGTPVPPPSTATVSFTLNVEVLVRETPSGAGRPLGSIPGGSLVTLVGRSGDNQWYQVDFGGGRGWITARVVPGSVNTGALPVR